MKQVMNYNKNKGLLYDHQNRPHDHRISQFGCFRPPNCKNQSISMITNHTDQRFDICTKKRAQYKTKRLTSGYPIRIWPKLQTKWRERPSLWLNRLYIIRWHSFRGVPPFFHCLYHRGRPVRSWRRNNDVNKLVFSILVFFIDFTIILHDQRPLR